jgi:hypothetical protein
MSEEEKKKDEKSDDDSVSSFEEMFDQYGEDWTLSIYRESPKELSGFLEEVTLEAGENPVNLQYLINQWGGKVLRLMLRDNKGVFRRRMLLQLKSFPPRVNGRIINQGIDDQKDLKTEFAEMLSLVKSMTPAPIPPPPPNNTLETLLPLIAPILRAVAERAMNPPLAVNAPSQAASITEMMGALSTMREFVQPAPEGGDMSAAFVGLAEKVLPLLVEKKNAAANHPPAPVRPMSPIVRPSVVPPAAQDIRPIAPIRPLPEENKSETVTVSEPTDEQLMEYLKNKLAAGGMGGDELTKLYFDTVSRLPENEQVAAERALEIALDLEPIVEASNDAPPIPRGSAGADTGNDKADRKRDKKSG